MNGDDTLMDWRSAAGPRLDSFSLSPLRVFRGFRRDLAVLPADYFTVAVQDISRIESMLTVAGGTIVYARLGSREVAR